MGILQSLWYEIILLQNNDETQWLVRVTLPRWVCPAWSRVGILTTDLRLSHLEAVCHVRM